MEIHSKPFLEMAFNEWKPMVFAQDQRNLDIDEFTSSLDNILSLLKNMLFLWLAKSCDASSASNLGSDSDRAGAVATGREPCSQSELLICLQSKLVNFLFEPRRGPRGCSKFLVHAPF